MNNYEADRETLKTLNDTVWALAKVTASCPFENQDGWNAITAERQRIAAVAKENGFIRIFDGSYKLNIKKYETAGAL